MIKSADVSAQFDQETTWLRRTARSSGWYTTRVLVSLQRATEASTSSTSPAVRPPSTSSVKDRRSRSKRDRAPRDRAARTSNWPRPVQAADAASFLIRLQGSFATLCGGRGAAPAAPLYLPPRAAGA